MLIRVRIDPRVIYAFMILTLGVNAAVFCICWKQIMGGKNDFPVFYSNAQMVHEGQASRLYDVEAENSFVRRVSDGDRAPNNHLPYELLIFLPFARLRFGAAYMLWTLLGLAMLGGVAQLTRNIWPAESRFGPIFLAILAFFPVWYCLLQGQDSILLLFLFALSFWLWRQRREDAAGFVLALGLFRPQLVLPFVLVTFLGGKWRFVRGFVPGAALVSLLSLQVVGIHGMTDYARILMLQGTQGSARTLAEQWQVRPGLMPTLRGLLWIVLPSSATTRIRSLLLLSVTLAALLWTARRMRSARDEATFNLIFALAVTVVTLVSFHSFIHDFSLMILPLLTAASGLAWSEPITETRAYSIVTVAFLFFLTPLYLVLLFTDKVGLFVLPTVAFLWLMSSWRMGSLGALSARRSPAEPTPILPV